MYGKVIDEVHRNVLTNHCTVVLITFMSNDAEEAVVGSGCDGIVQPFNLYLNLYFNKFNLYLRLPEVLGQRLYAVKS